MNAEQYRRKISAIFNADVAGYSRLMGDDEEDTVKTLTRYRAVMFERIRQHGGRVVDSPGDNLLAEFPSVVEALRCGLDVQRDLGRRNASLLEERRMQFRIGINLGDVIEEDGRLYGDAINVASRLESLADSGGISLSGTAYDQVKNKLPCRFDFQGEHRVKNIKDPVRVYRVEMASNTTTTVRSPKTAAAGRSISLRILLLMTTLLIVMAAAYWKYRQMPTPLRLSQTKGADAALAEKAAIAVLPFKNLSGDPEQEYFSDGITNDIITDLSRFRYLMVISGNTTFTYKNKPIDAAAIGREIGARYVLKGTIQKSDTDLRINTQLIDAANGVHLWAERYEREYKDIFKLQSEIVQAIVSRLALKTFKAERDRAMVKAPNDLQAYDYLLRGWEYFNRRTRSSNMRARALFSKAVALDSRYADAYSGLGSVDLVKATNGWTEFPQKTLENAETYARKALELDEANALAHSLLAEIYAFQNQYPLAIREAERAIELNPNDANSYQKLGFIKLWSGQTDEAIAALRKSLRLDSHTRTNAWMHLGMAYYLKGLYGKALEALEDGLVKRPDFVGFHIVLAATYARMGRAEDAGRAADAVRHLDPFFEADTFGTVFRNPAHKQALVEGLRMAGLK
ncbi:MAG: tetratricopeptide repeat protein [Desulfobacteraceae bacterium]